MTEVITSDCLLDVFLNFDLKIWFCQLLEVSSNQMRLF